jgi:hypothetical protein
MEPTNEILRELQEIAPFLGKEAFSRIPYGVPSGYFRDFPQMLMYRIQVETAVYQEPLSGQENAEISPLEEIAGISPLLASLQNKNTYQAPAGYLESWKVKFPESESVTSVPFFETASTTEAPVISMGTQTDFFSSLQNNRAFNFSKVLKYAVAACLVAMLGTTVFNISTHNELDPLLGLTTVSDQDMANYLDSDDIHWTPGITSSSETASVEFNDNDIHELLSSVPDDELEQYYPALPEEKGTVN